MSVATLTGAIIGLTACAPANDNASSNSSSTEAASSSTAPTVGGELNVGIWQVPPCLDPTITPYNNHPGRATVDNLLEQDLETGEIKPWLATAWQIADDGLSYTFTLREDVTFSNGEPFNAETVKANFDNHIEFRQREGRGVAAAYLDGYAGSEVIDEYTVRIDLSQRRAGFLQALTEKALGIVWPGSLTGSYDERCAGIVGTGPFIVDENVTGDHITVVRRDDYAWQSPNSLHEGPAYLDSITFVEIPESGVLTESLLSGSIDALLSTTLSDIDRIKDAGNVIESRVVGGIATTLYPNLAQAPFDDIAVRQAVQIGFDRIETNEVIFSEYNPPATSPVSTEVPGYIDLSAKLGYDPVKANEILENAGWIAGADGIREKNGQRLDAELVFTSDNDRPINQLLQSQLKTIGFDLQLAQVNSAENTARLQSGDWDLVRGGFTRADPDVLLSTYHPDYVSNARYTHETVADLVALLDAQTVELDQQKRNDVFAQALELIVDKGYSFPVNEFSYTVAHSASTHGFTYQAAGWNIFFDVWKEA